MKIFDSESLFDEKSLIFENWKIQIEGKFIVNNDHFLIKQTKMIYIFRRTTEDAQIHLRPRYGTNEDSFKIAQKMIDFFINIYLDSFKVKNAWQNYCYLNMKPAQTFTEFYIKFLHLAGETKISLNDW